MKMNTMERLECTGDTFTEVAIFNINEILKNMPKVQKLSDEFKTLTDKLFKIDESLYNKLDDILTSYLDLATIKSYKIGYIQALQSKELIEL